MWLQRPETARGRRFPTPRAQPEDAEPPTHNQNIPLEDEVKEKKSSRREDGCPELKVDSRINEEAEKERGNLDRKKEKQMLLQQEEQKSEEEEGGRRPREEDEERPR